MSQYNSPDMEGNDYAGLDEWLDEVEELLPPIQPTYVNDWFRASCTNTENVCSIHGIPFILCDCI